MNIEPPLPCLAYIVGIAAYEGMIVEVQKISGWTKYRGRVIWDCYSRTQVNGFDCYGRRRKVNEVAIPDDHLRRINAPGLEEEIVTAQPATIED